MPEIEPAFTRSKRQQTHAPRTVRVKGAVATGRQRVDAQKERFEGTLGGKIWGRLSGIEFIDHALLLAGTLTLWLIPSLIVLDRIKGESFSHTVSRTMGLTPAAESHLANLFRQGTSTSITIGAVVVIGYGLYGAASAVERLYELVFDLERRGANAMWRRAVWPLATIAVVAGFAELKRLIDVLPGSRIVVAVASFLVLAAFFWWSMHFLLAARKPWAELVAPAFVTALCWVGLGVFSSFYFSRMVISNDKDYGPIGVVFAIMTWLLAAGVVFILGPVVGAAWTSWRRERREAR